MGLFDVNSPLSKIYTELNDKDLWVKKPMTLPSIRPDASISQAEFCTMCAAYGVDPASIPVLVLESAYKTICDPEPQYFFAQYDGQLWFCDTEGYPYIRYAVRIETE
jgi:hypothetical protein